jgi:(p)ppGpp synthase/HD superfamily hydrolase
MSDLVADAVRVAFQWHDGQVRKYTQLPYFVHPVAVGSLVERAIHADPAWPGWKPNVVAVVAAAYLHDTIEDCGVCLPDFEAEFGGHGGLMLYDMVIEVTQVSKPGDGNRAHRKTMDAIHYSQASPGMASVKLADMIDNARDIQVHDPLFWKLYQKEMLDLLPKLRHGHESLWKQAYHAIHPTCSFPPDYL